MVRSCGADSLLPRVVALKHADSHIILTPECSKCERQRDNIFYVDNTTHVQGELRGTLSEEECVV